MSNQVNCFFGLHVYEIIKEEPIKDVRGEIIGIIYIEKCKHYGKITSYKIEY